MGLFKKIGNALKKTREALARKIDALLSHGELDDDFYDELTDILISCDIGVRTSMDIVDSLRLEARKNKIRTAEDVKNKLKKILKDVEEMYCAPMTPDFSVRVYIHCCTMLERMHTAKPIPMPLDADITISKNLLWYTKLKDVVLEACKAMNVDFVEAEAYYLMMALPTDDLIYEETRDGKEN